MARKVVRLNEAGLRRMISEMLGGPPDDDWHQLDEALAGVKRMVQGLQGEINIVGGNLTSPNRATYRARTAKGAQIAIQRLQEIVDRIAAASGGGAGA